MQAASALPVRRRFTADEFEHLAEVGILDDDRVELLDGDIVEMTPISSQHAGCVNALIAIFAGKLAERAVIAAQNPVRLDDFNEQQPDLCLLRPRQDRYRTSHPCADHILLLIEVAHTSLRYDEGIKVPLYSRYGVRETWIVDLDDSTVHVFRNPSSKGYRAHQRHSPGDMIAPEAFPEAAVDVAEIVGVSE
jgi:Uma2 family endonuclease